MQYARVLQPVPAEAHQVRAALHWSRDALRLGCSTGCILFTGSIRSPAFEQSICEVAIVTCAMTCRRILEDGLAETRCFRELYVSPDRWQQHPAIPPWQIGISCFTEEGLEIIDDFAG